jgi:hypothetical protein
MRCIYSLTSDDDEQGLASRLDRQTSSFPTILSPHDREAAKPTMLYTLSRAMNRRSPGTLIAIVAGLSIITACNAGPLQGRRASQIDVSEAQSLNYGVPLDGFLSYSIEFAILVDFAGNASNPNLYSNNLLDNLAAVQGRKPYIRVGGTTQGFYNFSETQAVQQVQTFTPTCPGPDQPRYITIGPSFFESFHTWPGAKFP